MNQLMKIKFLLKYNSVEGEQTREKEKLMSWFTIWKY